MFDFERKKGVVYIGRGVIVAGEIHHAETIVVNGIVEGRIHCKELVVATGAIVAGQTTSANIEVRGAMSGDVEARHAIILRATARVQGHWLCGEIIAERGALLQGHCVAGAQ